MTTTQIKATFGTRTFATASVTSGSPTLADSAASFTAADIGKTVTTASVAGGTVINSITDSGHAVMSANASGTTGPQSCTLTPAFANVALSGTGCPTGTDQALTLISPGYQLQALAAIGEWHAAAGTGQHAANAQNTAAAVGMILQEV